MVVVVVVGIVSKEVDFVEVLLELAVIHKGLFPFWNKLTLKLL